MFVKFYAMAESRPGMEQLRALVAQSLQRDIDGKRNRQRLESDLPIKMLTTLEREAAALVARTVWATAMKALGGSAEEAVIPQEGGNGSRLELKRGKQIDHKLYPPGVDLVVRDYVITEGSVLTRHEKEFAFSPGSVIMTTRQTSYSSTRGASGDLVESSDLKLPIRNEAGKEELERLLGKIQRPDTRVFLREKP